MIEYEDNNNNAGNNNDNDNNNLIFLTKIICKITKFKRLVCLCLCQTCIHCHYDIHCHYVTLSVVIVFNLFFCLRNLLLGFLQCFDTVVWRQDLDISEKNLNKRNSVRTGLCLNKILTVTSAPT